MMISRGAHAPSAPLFPSPMDTTVFNTSVRWQSTCIVNFFPLVYVQVFVCGPYPHWIFLSGRGGMYIHPMYIDGPIASFASFHNVNCPHGFLYFNTEVCACAVLHKFLLLRVVVLHLIGWTSYQCPPCSPVLWLPLASEEGATAIHASLPLLSCQEQGTLNVHSFILLIVIF